MNSPIIYTTQGETKKILFPSPIHTPTPDNQSFINKPSHQYIASVVAVAVIISIEVAELEKEWNRACIGLIVIKLKNSLSSINKYSYSYLT